jgi:hypothetical protein
MSVQTQILATRPANLKVYWPLNEASGNFADLSGNAKTGTAGNTPTYRAVGIAGYAVTLNGSDEYVVNMSDVIGAELSEVTMFLFLKGGAQSGKRILCIYTGGSGELSIFTGFAGFGQATNAITFYITNNAGTARFGNGATHDVVCLDSTWHSVAVTRYLSGADYKVRIWVDGILSIDSGTITRDAGQSCAQFIISSAFTTYFAGSVQHVAVWNAGLTTAEVLAIHNERAKTVVNPAAGSGVDFTTIQGWFDTVGAIAADHEATVYSGGTVGNLTIAATVAGATYTIQAATGHRHDLDATGALLGNVSIAGRLDDEFTITGLRMGTYTEDASNLTTQLTTLDSCIVSTTALIATSSSATSSMTLNATNCVFTGNLTATATDAGTGDAGILLTLLHCTIIGNASLVLTGGDTETIEGVAGNTMAASFVGTWTEYASTRIADDGSYGSITAAVADQIVGGGSYKLKAGARAINAGTNAGVAVDALGRTRPKGPGYDIGAYEIDWPSGGAGLAIGMGIGIGP